jgi:hypothetical protein
MCGGPYPAQLKHREIRQNFIPLELLDLREGLRIEEAADDAFDPRTRPKRRDSAG